MPNNLSKAMVSTTVANIVVMFLNICTGVLIARLLAPSGRGEVASLSAWIQNITWLASFGINQALTFKMAEGKSRDQVLGFAIFGTAVTIVIGLVSALIILPKIYIHQSNELATIALYASFSIPFMMIAEGVKALVAGKGDFAYLSKIYVLQVVVNVVSLVAFHLAFHLSVVGVIICWNVPMLVVVPLCIARLRNSGEFRWPTKELAKQSTWYGLRQQLANLGSIASRSLDIMLMPAVLVASQIGLYSVGATVSTAVAQLLSSVGVVLFPLATQSEDKGPMIAKGMRVVLMFGTILALVVGILAPFLVKAVYGPAFLGTVFTLRILLPGSVFIAATGVLASGLQAYDRPHLVGFAQMSGLIITVVGLGLFLRRYGIEAAAIVSLIAYATTFFAMLFFLKISSQFEVLDAFRPSLFVRDFITVVRRLQSMLSGAQEVDKEHEGRLPQQRKAPDLTGLKGALIVSTCCIGGLALIFVGSKFDGGLAQVAILLMVCLPAYVMAASDSTSLPSYIVGVWAFAPCIRRVFDWQLGAYQSLSLLSLLPLISSMAIFVAIYRRQLTLPGKLKTAVSLFLFALVIGLVMGVVRNGVAAIFDLLNYVVPFSTILYFASTDLGAEDRHRVIRSLVAISCIVSIYGWLQFVSITPWDAKWMIDNAKVLNSIGVPEPFKVRVFSTMNSPGSLSAMLTVAFVASLMEKRWRGPLGLFAVLLIASAFGLTMVRGAWIAAIAMILVFVMLGSSKDRGRKLGGILAFFLVLAVILPYIPGGSVIADRFATLGAVSTDQSYQDRSKFTGSVVQRVAAQPFGSGLGSIGQGTKIENSGKLGDNADFDNGYLALSFTFGILGALAVLYCLFLLVRVTVTALKSARAILEGAAIERLALASLASMALLLASANCLTGVAGFFVWLPIALSLSPETVEQAQVSFNRTLPMRRRHRILHGKH